MTHYKEKYYKESGAVNTLSVTGGVGWVYVYISYYYPFPVFNLIVTVGYVSLIGYSLSLSIKLFKIRNQNFCSYLSLLLGLAAIYVSWLWFVAVGEGSFVWNPIEMAKVVYSHQIWWGIYVAWILEAALILFGMWLSVNEKIAELFCEQCNEWLEKTEINNLESADKLILVNEMEKHNYNYLMNLNTIEDNVYNQLRVKLYYCNSCFE